jgi:hypothetical protein
MPDERVRKRVLQAVSLGHLPATLPSKTWGGFGSGAVCALCAKSITVDQLETEFEDPAQRGRIYRLHLQCQAAWESVCGDAGGALAARLQPLTDGGYAPTREHERGTRLR